MRQENYDYATELFTQCVVGDPQNLLYVQGFLGNLKLKHKNNRKGDKLASMKTLRTRGVVKKAAMQKDWAAVIRTGLEVLKLNPWDVATLKIMASACAELGADDCQLAYLRVALETNPKDPDTNRVCGDALAKRKLLDQAIACWHRAQKARPGE
ncbi:MAG: tetratricopeptide repeat protein [Thermoguttaceae bacterium]